MLRRTNYGLWVDDKGYNSETENAIEYIVACAKENGIEVIEGQTALSIPFIAKIMKAMNENKRPKEEWTLSSEKMPEESGYYLVSGEDKVWICEMFDSGYLKGWCNDARNPVVEAWMPLPEPMKVGEENC